MEIIEKYKNELANLFEDPKKGITTIDIRVTFARKGVKVYISFSTSSRAQKKPLPTFTEAFKDALASYIYYAHYRIGYFNREWPGKHETEIALLKEAIKVTEKYLQKLS